MNQSRVIVPGTLSALALAVILSGPTPITARPAADPTMEQRLRKVEDELAIRRVILNYSAAIDARDPDAYAAVFARDGEWINGKLSYKGKDAIHKFVAGMFGNMAAAPVSTVVESYTLNSNAQIDVSGDHATARSRQLLMKRGVNGAPTPTLAGRYEDEFIREDGQWKILRRVDFPIMPSPEEWMKQMQERRKAQP